MTRAQLRTALTAGSACSHPAASPPAEPDNREAIERINRRLGYRLQLREISWPSEVAVSAPFTVRTRWANAGVAPCYPGGFWAVTLKDAKGGIVSVNVNEAFDLKQLPTAAPGQALAKESSGQFVVGRRQPDGGGPATQAGLCDLFISVGHRDGTPVIALPLPDSDGQRRYKVGQVRVREQ